MQKELPFIQKLSYTLLVIVLIVVIMYYTRTLMVPLFIAALIAILLRPLSARLENWGVPRPVAAVFCLLLAVAVVVGAVYLISTQVRFLVRDLPLIQQRLAAIADRLNHFLQSSNIIPYENGHTLINDNIAMLFSSGSTLILRLFNATSSVFAFSMIIPIYVFFMLLYRSNIKIFLIYVLQKHPALKEERIVIGMQEAIQNYVSGILLVVLILWVINSIGLSIIGVNHAIFFAAIAALLNIIPFLGTFVGSSLPVAYVLITDDSLWLAATIVIFMTVVQLCESYLITPNVVGDKVSVNPLSIIIALILGGTVWGLPGLFLAMPAVAILKVAFDNIEGLKPYGILLGSELSHRPASVSRLLRRRRDKSA
jgi:predicted PurR-regulated permease PerM